MLFPGKSKCKDNRQREVVSEESENCHIVKNPSQYCIYHYHIDGDIIPKDDTSGERCDYILEAATQPKPTAFIIELKGSNLLKAARQIEATITRYKQQLANYEIHPRIICHYITTNAIHNNVFIRFKDKYPKLKYKARILIDTI